MQGVRYFLRLFFFVLVIVLAGAFIFNYYSWIFAKTVTGKIVSVERVTNPSAIVGGSRLTPEQMFSFSILIEGDDGKLYTSTSEDRQWQVAAKGYCVKALLYRYPPWDLDKAGTFFNARLKELSRCDATKEPEVQAPAPLDTKN